MFLLRDKCCTSTACRRCFSYTSQRYQVDTQTHGQEKERKKHPNKQTNKQNNKQGNKERRKKLKTFLF